MRNCVFNIDLLVRQAHYRSRAMNPALAGFRLPIPGSIANCKSEVGIPEGLWTEDFDRRPLGV
jgi:hypothetical protein